MLRTLVYAPNWLGDAVMAMPALQVWRKWNTGTSLTVITKPSLAGLWKLHKAVDDIVLLRPGLWGTLRAANELKQYKFSEALILPNSFRSALIPRLAGIPRRRGFDVQGRSALLTERASPRLSSTRAHQCWEAADILLGEGWWPGEGLPAPNLHLMPYDMRSACRSFGLPPNGLRIGILPGAARGDSKRWPYFGEVARKLTEEVDNFRFLVLGTEGEASLCNEVCRTIGSAAKCVAGHTSLQQLAALLSTCRLVLCNDSGGMHLAAAVGTPVVAVFGLTDPYKTGPLGEDHIFITPSDVQGQRDIARRSLKATQALRSIPPEQVLMKVRQVLRTPPRANFSMAGL